MRASTLAWAVAAGFALPCAHATDATDAARPWRAAVVRGDAPAIADLARLPFLYEGRHLDRARFIAEAVPGLFTPAIRRCLERAPARPEGADLVLWCRPYAFYLRRDGGAWRLAEFAVDTP